MQMNRRDLLIASGIPLLAGRRAFGQAAAGPPPDGPAARLLEALFRNRLPLTMNGGPAGAGWDWLVREARAAQFTLIGEDHGVAETARFSAALFDALRSSGYRRVAIEVSPPMAEDFETAARRGLQGVMDFLALPGVAGMVYGMREEAQFLVDVVKGAPGNERVLWGLDYEIGSDRHLIPELEAKAPRAARDAVLRLKEASNSAWARFQRDWNPDEMFSLSQDPALVSAVRTAWPDPDRESATILRALEETLAITTTQRTEGRFAGLQRRTEWTRRNLAERLREEGKNGPMPKVMLKFGYNHMIRGANYLNVFDLGTMADQVAAMEGGRSFHILVLPGSGSRQAVLERNYASVPSEEYDEFNAGDQRLTRVLSNPRAAGHEVIDLRASRPLAMRGLDAWNPDVVRTIHGYDAAVIWKGAQASSPVRKADSD
jgi:hypothetical protein